MTFFNSPRCCCGSVDVLLGVRIIAALAIFAQMISIPTAWKQTKGVAALETVYGLMYILFAVLVFVGVAKKNAKLLLPYTVIAGFNVAVCAGLIIFSFFVVPFLPPMQGHVEVSPVAIGIMMGLMGVFIGFFALWFFAIAHSAYRVLNDNPTYASGVMGESFA